MATTFEEKVESLKKSDSLLISTADLISSQGERRLKFIKDAIEGMTVTDLLNKYDISRHTANRWIDKYLVNNISNTTSSDTTSSTEDKTSNTTSNKSVDNTNEPNKINSSNLSGNTTTSNTTSNTVGNTSSKAIPLNRNTLYSYFVKATLIYDEARQVNLYFYKTLRHIYENEPDMWKLLADDLSVRKDDKAIVYRLVMKMIELRCADVEHDSDYFILFLKDINDELQLDTHTSGYRKYLNRDR